MSKDAKTVKVKNQNKIASLNAPGAIKKGVDDSFRPRNNRQDSEDIDKALDSSGVFDNPEDTAGEGSTPDNNKPIEAGEAPPVIDPGSESAPEAGKAPPVVAAETVKPATPPVDKKTSLTDPVADKKAKEDAEALAKKTPPPAVKPEVPAIDPKLKDDEVDKIQPEKNLSAAAKSNWEKLAKLAKDRGNNAKQFKEKYEQAVTDINKIFKERGKLPEPVEKELNELRSFKKLHDYENDPEFRKQYVDGIKSNDQTIESILKANGMEDSRINMLKKDGFLNADPKLWNEWVFGPLEKAGSKEELQAQAVLKSLLEKNRTIDFQMKEELKKANEGKSEYWNNRQKAQETEVAEERQFVEKEVNVLMDKYPFLKPQEVPANATPEQKEHINKSNQYVQFLHTKFQEHYRPKTSTDKLQTAIAAVYAYIAEDQFVATQQKYEADKTAWESEKAQLEQQLEDIKKAGITSGAGESTPPKPAGINPIANIGKKSIDAIEEGLAAAEAGLR
jgi:hypothetical protein